MSGFHKPEPPQRFSLLLIGSWGDGKSHVLHTFPGLGVIDTQHGESSHFAARAEHGEFPPFVCAEATTFAEVNALLREIKNGRPQLKTCGIDSLTPPHRRVYKDCTRSANGREWTNEGEILRIEGEFGDLLRSLPMHIVATAEPRDVRAKVGSKLNGQVVGDRDVKIEKEAPRFKDSIGHVFDYIVRMRRSPDGGSIATFLKSKDESRIKRGEEIHNLTFALLEKRLRATPPAAAPPMRGERLADAIVTGDVDDEGMPARPELIRAIERAQAETRTTHRELADITIRVTKTVHDYKQTTNAQAREIFDVLAHAKAGAA